MTTGDGDKLYEDSDWIAETLSNWRTRMVIAHIRHRGIAEPGLLDLACGDNNVVRELGSGQGVDISDYEGVDVVCPDFTQLPFDDDYFPYASILASLNYFPDPTGVLSEVKRVLKADGELLITLLDHRVSALWHTFKERDWTPRPAFSRRELITMLDVAGLEIKTTRRFMLGLNCLYIIGNKAG